MKDKIKIDPDKIIRTEPVMIKGYTGFSISLAFIAILIFLMLYF